MYDLVYNDGSKLASYVVCVAKTRKLDSCTKDTNTAAIGVELEKVLGVLDSWTTCKMRRAL